MKWEEVLINTYTHGGTRKHFTISTHNTAEAHLQKYVYTAIHLSSAEVRNFHSGTSRGTTHQYYHGDQLGNWDITTIKACVPHIIEHVAQLIVIWYIRRLVALFMYCRQMQLLSILFPCFNELFTKQFSDLCRFVLFVILCMNHQSVTCTGQIWKSMTHLMWMVCKDTSSALYIIVT